EAPMEVVDIVRAEADAQQLLEEIGLLVAGVCRADAAHRRGAVAPGDRLEALGDQREHLVPAGRLQLAVAANQRRAQALWAIYRRVVPAAAVAEEPFVDAIVGAAILAQHFVHTHVHAHVATDRALPADTRRTLELPGARDEPIVLRRQRAYGAHLDDIAREG